MKIVAVRLIAVLFFSTIPSADTGITARRIASAIVTRISDTFEAMRENLRISSKYQKNSLVRNISGVPSRISENGSRTNKIRGTNNSMMRPAGHGYSDSLQENLQGISVNERTGWTGSVRADPPREREQQKNAREHLTGIPFLTF
jgi:hypothetical protein